VASITIGFMTVGGRSRSNMEHRISLHRGGPIRGELRTAAEKYYSMRRVTVPPVEMWPVLPVVELVETRMVNLDKLGDRASR